MKDRDIKAVLFDLDGVLVDMPEGHYQALNKALELFGTTICREEHFGYFNGLPTRKKIQKLEELDRLPPGLCEFINSIKQKYTKDIIPKYCAPDYSKIVLMNELRARGYKIGCCSNSVRETLHYMLQCAQLYDFFDIIIGNDDVERPKPDPEIYLAAFTKLGVKPHEAIIVEDAPHGIAAARASGATVYEVKGVQDVDTALFKSLLEHD